MTAEQGAQLSYTEVVNDPALKLTAFERQCGLLWPTHRDPAKVAALVYSVEFAERADYSKTKWKAFEREACKRVMWAVKRVFGKLEAAQYTQVSDSLREHNRSIMEACRNRRESGRTPETHVGVKPYGPLDDEKAAERRTREEYLAAREDLKNYRAVSLRGATVTAAALDSQSPAERLTTFARHLAAQRELASASV